MPTIRRYQRCLKHLNANLGHAAIRDPQSACSAERKSRTRSRIQGPRSLMRIPPTCWVEAMAHITVRRTT